MSNVSGGIGGVAVALGHGEAVARPGQGGLGLLCTPKEGRLATSDLTGGSMCRRYSR